VARVRGWYGTPLIVTEPVADPEQLYAACQAEHVPIRRLYDDWLSTPLLRNPTLLHGLFPHLRHSPWTPPDPTAFPTTPGPRRQTLLIKVPDVPAADYMDQVGAALTTVLTRL
jgi:hypothetical protein